MDVVAEIGTIDLPVRDVLSLRAGDVVRLSNVRVGDPLTLSVGTNRTVNCRTRLLPGKSGK